MELRSKSSSAETAKSGENGKTSNAKTHVKALTQSKMFKKARSSASKKLQNIDQVKKTVLRKKHVKKIVKPWN